MTLVRSTELLQHARAARFAVGAFNADNMEIVQAIVEAACEERAPVILQVSGPAIRYAGLALLTGIVKTAAAEADVPVVLHLDHGDSLEQNVLALRAGFTSLMFDGSRLPYADNLAITKQIAHLAHVVGVPLEAELGKVLHKGAAPEDVADALTDPDEAADFVARTGCDSLAVAVGSVHAMTAQEAQLDVERVRAIARRVSIPLVLHGSSGVQPESVIAVIAEGVCKVNVSTYIKQTFVAELRAAMSASPTEVDFRKLFAPARAAAKERVREKLRLFGASGRISGTGGFRSPATLHPSVHVTTGDVE